MYFEVCVCVAQNKPSSHVFIELLMSLRFSKLFHLEETAMFVRCEWCHGHSGITSSKHSTSYLNENQRWHMGHACCVAVGNNRICTLTPSFALMMISSRVDSIRNLPILSVMSSLNARGFYNNGSKSSSSVSLSTPPTSCICQLLLGSE